MHIVYKKTLLIKTLTDSSFIFGLAPTGLVMDIFL